MTTTTKRTCRKCGKPSGAFWYCPAHRKQNAAKARARNSARRGSHFARSSGVGAGGGPSQSRSEESAPNPADVQLLDQLIATGPLSNDRLALASNDPTLSADIRQLCKAIIARRNGQTPVVAGLQATLQELLQWREQIHNGVH